MTTFSRTRACTLAGRVALAVAALIAVGCPARDSTTEGRNESKGRAPELATAAEPSPYFVDATEASGLDFVHFNGMSGDFTLVEEMGAGAALFDYDNDGDLDLYLVQGHMLGDKPLAEATFPPRRGAPLRDRLVRNDLDERGLRFVDVTASMGTDGAGYGMGVAVGDIDRDGWLDVYVTNVGPNQLLRNLGVGADGVHRGFADVTKETGTGDEGFTVPAVFFDYDRDGWLDLFLGNYVHLRSPTPVCRLQSGSIDYCGPASYAPAGDRLLRNTGRATDGSTVRYDDVTVAAGLRQDDAPALGAVALDADDDGWLDLYVANDDAANHLWMNQGDGTFVDAALIAGCAVDAEGKAQGSMGLVAADLDGDGDTDLLSTHRVTETNTFYRNDGSGLFDDATRGSGLGPASRRYTAFGAGALDVDHDGLLDLLITNGAVNTIEAQVVAGDPHPLREPDQLFLARRDEATGVVSFEEAARPPNSVLATMQVGRGLAFGDVDNDGDIDAVVTNNAGPARLLLNVVGQDVAWLGLRLVDASEQGGPPRDVLGARVALLRDGQPIAWRRVATDGSYLSAHDARVRFGLGEAAGDPPSRNDVRVTWPDGREETFEALASGRYHALARGSGVIVASAP